MSVTLVQGSAQTPSSKDVESPLSRKEVENLVGGANAEEIEFIANCIINRIMLRLEIENPPIKFTKDPVSIPEKHESVFDKKRLRDLLLPLLIDQISKSFSIPSSFFENGLMMTIIGQNPQGLINEITLKQEEEFRDYLEGVSARFLNRKSFELKRKARGYAITLKLGEPSRHKLSKLHYQLKESYFLYQ